MFRNAQPLIIQDVRADQRHFKVVDRMTNQNTHSLVAVPLMVRGEVVGVLEALNKKDDAHYTEEDLTILETLGALAAQAMQTVELMRKVRASRVQLAELERLKTDFIAITSHELRTPLALIRMFAETLSMGRLKDEEVERLRQVVDSYTQRVPAWIMNRPKDTYTGEARHILGTDLARSALFYFENQTKIFPDKQNGIRKGNCWKRLEFRHP